MGKSTLASAAKSKEARAVRKAEQRRLADASRLVAAANSLPVAELHSTCDELLLYQLPDLQLNITCSRVTDLAPDLLDWAIHLTETNMKKLYEECAWGWNLRKKTEEMSEDAAWYAVVRQPATAEPPVAFAHFRFDIDYGEPVLYCYEVQVEAAWRGRGVGARLLRLLERLAATTRMRCVRLTALRHNPRAAAFFRAAGYTVDETSPEAEEAAHYEILSKLAPPSPPPHASAGTTSAASTTAASAAVATVRLAACTLTG